MVAESETDLKVANLLQVIIMKKEFLVLEIGSREERDRLIHHFKECIEFSASGMFVVSLSSLRLTFRSTSSLQESSTAIAASQCLPPSSI
jgi:hypothetical protein